MILKGAWKELAEKRGLLTVARAARSWGAIRRRFTGGFARGSFPRCDTARGRSCWRLVCCSEGIRVHEGMRDGMPSTRMPARATSRAGDPQQV